MFFKEDEISLAQPKYGLDGRLFNKRMLKEHADVLKFPEQLYDGLEHF